VTLSALMAGAAEPTYDSDFRDAHGTHSGLQQGLDLWNECQVGRCPHVLSAARTFCRPAQQ
jgi:hypothetical protein